MVSDLPDDWFRPARTGEDGDAGGSIPPDHEDGDEDPNADSQAPASAEDRSESTLDPETTGRLSLGDPDDDEGLSVVVGRPASEGRGGDGAGPAQRNGIRWSRVLLAAVFCLVLGLVLGILVRGRNSQDEPLSRGTADAGAVAAGASALSQAVPWQGVTRPVPGVTAQASCPLVPGRAGKGGYPASNAVDEDLNSAWRCDGSAVGQRLVLDPPQDTTLVGVGIVNGLAQDGGYEEYRRVLKVRWTLADGSWFAQDLTDGRSTMQTLLISAHRLDGPVELTILASSRPGDPEHDAIVIPQVSLLTES